MSVSVSLNNLLLEIIISFKNEGLIIGDLKNRTLQVIFDGWGAFINMCSMHSIAWKYSRNVLFPHFNLDCGIEDNSSPGIICIVCDQVLCHPSEHGSSSIGKHLLAKEHIAKFNELTESKVSQLTSTTVDDTALAMWKRQGS